MKGRVPSFLSRIRSSETAGSFRCVKIVKSSVKFPVLDDELLCFAYAAACMHDTLHAKIVRIMIVWV